MIPDVREVAHSIVDSDRTWISIEAAMKKYADEVVDRCMEVAMAEDILNNSAAIKGEPYSAVWRAIHRVRNEIK